MLSITNILPNEQSAFNLYWLAFFYNNIIIEFYKIFNLNKIYTGINCFNLIENYTLLLL